MLSEDIIVRTVISFAVNVPVLSEQITLTQPFIEYKFFTSYFKIFLMKKFFSYLKFLLSAIF